MIKPSAQAFYFRSISRRIIGDPAKPDLQDQISLCLSLGPGMYFSHVACPRCRNCLSNFLTLGRKEGEKTNYTTTGLLTFKIRK